MHRTYHIPSFSPLGPVAIVGKSLGPITSILLRHLRVPHSEKSFVVMIALVNPFAALQYGQSRKA